MAGKNKAVFVCSECGYESPKWSGRCPSCGEWNTMNEEIKAPARTAAPGGSTLRRMPQRITELNPEGEQRYRTGMKELDRVLGGGIVKGGLMLIGGDPGIGKSTLLLQICAHLGQSLTILYVSGEESERQIKLRADRLGVASDNLFVLCETDVQSILEAMYAQKPDILIVDSIQTMSLAEVSSSPGSVTQVRECTGAIMRAAKSVDTPVFIVGHVNKDGNIAGPKVMEHIVDCVLYFEGDRHTSYRMLRCVKNRYGATNEIGVFEMRQSGLEEVENPSEYMLSGRPEQSAGSVVACSMEGTRPILIEIQALVCRSNFGMPRRTAAGTDYNRVNLLMAVLEKRLGMALSNSDAYVNIAGGIRMNEPAIDLGIVMALVSSYRNRPVDEKTIVFGEVGLSGEVRAVNMPEQRVAEAKKLGFETCILPQVCMKMVKDIKGIRLIGVKSVNEAVGMI